MAEVGPLDRESRATLSFADSVASSAPAPLFWRVAAVAGVLDQVEESESVGIRPVAAALDEALLHVGALPSLASQMVLPSGWLAEESWGYAVLGDTLRFPAKGLQLLSDILAEMFTVKIIPDEWYSTPHNDLRCCVEEFNYPQHLEFESGACWTGFNFIFGAKYSDDKPCECDCCYFRQFVRATIVREIVPPELVTRVTTTGERHVEDCAVYDRDGKAKGNTAEGERADEAGDYYKCYPGRWNEGNNVRNYSPKSCWWANTDSPRAYTSCFLVVRGDWEFLGVVYDTCKNWQVRAIKSFKVRLEGIPPFAPVGSWQ